MRATIRFRRTLATVLVAAVVTAPARSTWSIVAVDTATGEVCVASATCLTGINLRNELAVVRVGLGGGAAQSQIDQSGKNRREIWKGFKQSRTPAEILATLAATDGAHQARQYGIVDAFNSPIAFTGSQAGNGKHHVAGVSGTLFYSVQGNVLTGKKVVAQAVLKLLTAKGDLGQRVMAAMEDARALGGDGRCSCKFNKPTQCGTPPPSFKTSALVAFIVLARIGDTDGVCASNVGCANGDYYMNLNVTPGTLNVDAVEVLQGKYDAWRAGLVGRPDHLLSRVRPEVTVLPATGKASTTVVVELVDVDGNPLDSGGAALSIERVGGPATPLTTIDPVVDRGDGTYSFRVQAGRDPGKETLKVVVDDGVSAITLYPHLGLRVAPHDGLIAGFDSVRTSSEIDLPFTIDAGDLSGGRFYLLLASASGTTPGLVLEDTHIPLNFDPFFQCTLGNPVPCLVPGSVGMLNKNGRAVVRLVGAPGEFAMMAGMHLDWTALIPGERRVTNVVGVEFEP